MKRLLRIASCLLACGAILAATAQSAPSLHAASLPAIRLGGLPASAFAVFAAPLDAAAPLPASDALSAAARPLIAHRVQESVNPASVMKLVTTAAALDLLGEGFAWQNRVWVDGVQHGDVLHGNVYLKGAGDPKLVVERLTPLLQAVQDAGIRHVRGAWVLDQSLWQLPPHDPADFDGDPKRPYNAGPAPLLINFKAKVLKFKPDAAAGVARIEDDLPLAGVQLQTSVPLSHGKGCGDWRGQLRAENDNPQAITFSGAYPAACGERQWPFAYAAPDEFAPRAVLGVWQQLGGTAAGGAKLGVVPTGARTLLGQPSQPLWEVVRDTNKFSNNVLAQQLFLSLGSYVGGNGGNGGNGSMSGSMGGASATTAQVLALKPGQNSFDLARAVLERWWRSKVGAQPPVVMNGSGLSRQERVSAADLSQLLGYIWRNEPLRGRMVESLPIYGVDGTLSDWGGKAVGRAWLKTGSLRNVKALAGFVRASSGQMYQFVAVVNHPSAAKAGPALQDLVDYVAAQ